MELADGNYQINDQDSGEVLFKWQSSSMDAKVKLEPLTTPIFVCNFQNQILAIDEEGNFHRHSRSNRNYT
eukprot:UN13625